MSCSIKSIRPKQWSHGLTQDPLLAEANPVHNTFLKVHVSEAYNVMYQLHYIYFLFSIKMHILFYCRKKLFGIYTSKGVGSFLTPGLNTCTFLANERKQGLQCYSLGALGLGFLSIVVY